MYIIVNNINILIKSREDYKIFPAFYYLTLVQHTKHPVPHPLNHLFNLIKFLPQFLCLVTISDDGQAPLRNLHRHAAPGLKSRLGESVTRAWRHGDRWGNTVTRGINRAA